MIVNILVLAQVKIIDILLMSVIMISVFIFPIKPLSNMDLANEE